MAPKLQSNLNSMSGLYKTRRLPLINRIQSRWCLALAMCAMLALAAMPVQISFADQPSAQSLVTDKTNLPLSDQFGVTN